MYVFSFEPASPTSCLRLTRTRSSTSAKATRFTSGIFKKESVLDQPIPFAPMSPRLIRLFGATCNFAKRLTGRALARLAPASVLIKLRRVAISVRGMVCSIKVTNPANPCKPLPMKKCAQLPGGSFVVRLSDPGRCHLVETAYFLTQISLYPIANTIHIVKQIINGIRYCFIQVFTYAASNGRRLSVSRNGDLEIALGNDRSQIEIAKVGSIRNVEQQSPPTRHASDIFMERPVVCREEYDIMPIQIRLFKWLLFDVDTPILRCD